MKKIIFNETSKRFILDAFDKSVDDEGYVVENSDCQRVISIDGEELKEEKLAAIKKGSQIYIKDDLVSLIELHKLVG